MFVRSPDTPSLILSAQQGDREALDILVKENMGLVKSIAFRFRDRAETDDLIQLGVIGLIKAIRGFSFEHETVLSTYAVPLITGEIKRFLRDDGTVKVSRELKKRGRILLKAREDYISETGLEPTVQVLSEKCGFIYWYYLKGFKHIRELSRGISHFLYSLKGIVCRISLRSEIRNRFKCEVSLVSDIFKSFYHFIKVYRL